MFHNYLLKTQLLHEKQTLALFVVSKTTKQ